MTLCVCCYVTMETQFIDYLPVLNSLGWSCSQPPAYVWTHTARLVFRNGPTVGLIVMAKKKEKNEGGKKKLHRGVSVFKVGLSARHLGCEAQHAGIGTKLDHRQAA